MRNTQVLVITVTALLCGACGSGPIPADQRVVEVRSVKAVPIGLAAFKLGNEVTFVVPGGQGIMGDMRYRLLPGEYVVHAVDDQGTYYRHRNRGIKRSGDTARVGGLFVPLAKDDRWGLWIVPNNADTVYGMFGTAAIAVGVPDQKTTVVYQANIPLELLPSVQAEVAPQLKI